MDDLKKLLQENLEYTRQIHEQVKKIQSYVFWSKIFGVIKLIIVVVPVIFAIVYGIPLLREALETYKGFMGNLGESGYPSDLPVDLLKNLLKK